MTRTETLALQRAIHAEFGWGLREDAISGPKPAAAHKYYLDQKTPHNVPPPAQAGATPWDLSVAVIGILVSGAALVANVWGWEVDVEQAITLAVGIGGFVVSLIGTIRRSSPIDAAVIAPGVRLPTRATPMPPDRPADRPTGPFGY